MGRQRQNGWKTHPDIDFLVISISFRHFTSLIRFLLLSLNTEVAGYFAMQLKAVKQAASRRGGDELIAPS